MINPIDLIIPIGLVSSAVIVLSFLAYQILGLRKDLIAHESLFKQGGNN